MFREIPRARTDSVNAADGVCATRNQGADVLGQFGNGRSGTSIPGDFLSSLRVVVDVSISFYVEGDRSRTRLRVYGMNIRSR